jgi:TolA-binding protein
MNLAEPGTDKQIAELVGLAQRELHGETLLSDEAGFSKLQLRMNAPPRFWSRGWVAGLAAAGAATAFAATLLVLQASPAKLSFQVAGGALDAKGHVVGGEHTLIRFSDGSEAALARGAEAQIANVTERGADVVLTRGSMHVHIAKKPEAAWKVAAGPYDVRVTGTAFDVSWSSQSQAFDLRMETGAVIVTGPLAGSGIVLRAGQHLFGGVAEGRLTVEGGSQAAASPTPAPALSAREPAEPSPAREPSDVAPPAPSPAPHAGTEAHAWTRQVAQGHFNAVLNEAEQRGLDRTLSGGSLEELAALADAARYAGRSAVAKRVLMAERQRFPSSAAARDAAFFLGRIAEESGGGAVEWYERYVSESPRGAYASQAFGRKMMLLYKQRGANAAGPVATEYLSRYPNGPYAAAARKIDQELQPAPKP